MSDETDWEALRAREAERLADLAKRLTNMAAAAPNLADAAEAEALQDRNAAAFAALITEIGQFSLELAQAAVDDPSPLDASALARRMSADDPQMAQRWDALMAEILSNYRAASGDDQELFE